MQGFSVVNLNWLLIHLLPSIGFILALANERLPPRLRALMLFMSTTLVGAFVFLGVRGIFAHVYMLVTLAVSIHLLYMVIEDLDHPFYGVWNISRKPLDELVKRFEQN